MILIPFGLQAKPYRPPWFTFLLVGMIFFLNGKLLNLPTSFDMHNKQLNLLLQFFQFKDPVHLATSCVLMLLFGCYVELRIGTFLYFMTYVISAVLAWTVSHFAFKNLSLDYPVVGAFSLAGCFLILFLDSNYRFMHIHLNGRKTFIFAPNPLVMFLATTLVLGLHFFVFNKLPISEVVGIVIGVILSLVWAESVFVKKGFVFPIEANYLMNAKKETDAIKKIDWILECIKINPSNPSAIEYLFRSIAKSKVSAYFFTDDQKKIIAYLISSIIKKQIKVDLNLVIYYFSILPLTWNLTEIGIHNLNDKDLAFIDDLLMKSEWRLSLRIYDVYLSTENNQRKRKMAKKSIIKILHELIRVGLKLNDIQWLETYCAQMPNSLVSELIRTEVKLSKPTQVA